MNHRHDLGRERWRLAIKELYEFKGKEKTNWSDETRFQEILEKLSSKRKVRHFSRFLWLLGGYLRASLQAKCDNQVMTHMPR